MTRSLLSGLDTISHAHCYPVMTPQHVTKQHLLYSTLLMSHRYYSDKKQDGELTYVSTMTQFVHISNFVVIFLLYTANIKR